MAVVALGSRPDSRTGYHAYGVPRSLSPDEYVGSQRHERWRSVARRRHDRPPQVPKSVVDENTALAERLN